MERCHLNPSPVVKGKDIRIPILPKLTDLLICSFAHLHISKVFLNQLTEKSKSWIIEECPGVGRNSVKPTPRRGLEN